MNRVYSGFFAIAIALFALLSLNMLTAQSATLQQAEPDEAGETIELSQPVRVELRQQVPLSVTVAGSAVTTESGTLTETVTISFDLGVEILVTHAPTSSAVSTVTIVLTGTEGITLPVTLTLTDLPAADISITPLPVPEPPTATEEITATAPITSAGEITDTESITSADEITDTGTITDTPGITDTATITPGAGIPVISTTTTVTANLRAGPSTDLPISSTIQANAAINIVAVSQDGAWYLLDNGQWIFSTLTADQPQDLPVATPELIEAVNQAAAQAPSEPPAEPESAEPEVETAPEIEPSAAPTPTTTTAPTATTALTATTAPTLTVSDAPTGTAPIEAETAPSGDETAAPTVNVNANLRSGPSTDAPVIGGTVTGEELDIIGQNSDGSWFLLSNGGWVASFLVDNPPTDAPVVPDEATPESVAAGESGPALLPTPTPVPTGQDTGSGLSEDETAYVGDARSLVSRYQVWSNALSGLVIEAENNAGVLQDPNWTAGVTNGIEAINQIGAAVRETDPPAFFAAAHIDLVGAADAFDAAAATLAEGAANGNFEQLQEGAAAVDQATLLAEQARDRLADLAR